MPRMSLRFPSTIIFRPDVGGLDAAKCDKLEGLVRVLRFLDSFSLCRSRGISLVRNRDTSLSARVKESTHDFLRTLMSQQAI
jgi:hypothetical protein